MMVCLSIPNMYHSSSSNLEIHNSMAIAVVGISLDLDLRTLIKEAEGMQVDSINSDKDSNSSTMVVVVVVEEEEEEEGMASTGRTTTPGATITTVRIIMVVDIFRARSMAAVVAVVVDGSSGLV